MTNPRIQTKEEFYTIFNTLKERFHKMKPELEVTVRDTAMDIEGYVVVWNTAICKDGPFDQNGKGIGKGGTRILPNLKLEDIKRLARSMAEKNAAAGLPLGGAKSGMVGDCNADDYEQKYKRFVTLVQKSNILAENGGIFGGFGYDVGCKPPLNAQWACDALGTLNSFTGKPVEKGGTDYDREGIAGLGVSNAAKALLTHKNIPLEKATFSVQGTGAMGAAVIHYFTSYGAQLFCLSDPKYGGTWTLENKASNELIAALFAQDKKTALKCLKAEGTLTSKDSQDALYAKTDVIFPCALEDVLTKDNAHKVTAPFICEGANNPTTDEAHDILLKNEVLVIPDIIANAGGIIAAYIELSSDVTVEENIQTRAKVTQAKDETIRRVTDNTQELLNMVDKLGVPSHMVGDYMAYRNIFYGLPST